MSEYRSQKHTRALQLLVAILGLIRSLKRYIVTVYVTEDEEEGVYRIRLPQEGVQKHKRGDPVSIVA